MNELVNGGKEVGTLIESNEEVSIFSGLPDELVQSLSPAKIRMILLYLSGHYTQTKIAKIIGVSDNTIRTWLLDDSVQTVMRELQAKEFAVVEASLKAMRYKALNTMDELMDSTMDNVRFQAAKDVLDRGGHKPQNNIKVEKTVVNLEQQLASLQDFTINEEDIIDIDIDDLVDEVKNG